MQQPFTLALDSPASVPSAAGGKGNNLSVLSRDGGGIPVPPGFVITTAAYRDFVEEDDGQFLNEIESALNRFHDDDDQDAEATSAAIRSAFRRRHLSKALRTEIYDRLSDLFPDLDQTFAVRSSATCEDMPDASFAGQHDTYLNVPRDEVCEGVVDCFSSLFAGRAISYRERNGLSHLEARMAVVVQAMASDQMCSGVLFTANPLTGRRNECVLEAIPGLGEALVSGLTEPDRYVVAKHGNANDGSAVDFNIKDRRVGAKAKVIRSVEGGGITEVQSAQDEDRSSSAEVLNDDDVERIVALGQKVEELYEGNPQDIEWAMSNGGEICIVQSRPITTLFPLPKNVPPEPLQVYFSFNAVQGIVAPIYPAGQDTLRSGLLGGLLRWISWGRFGDEGTFLQPVAERLYINVTNPLRNSLGRKVLCNVLPAIEPGIMTAFEQLLEEPDMRVQSGFNPALFFRILTLASVIVPRYIFSMMLPNWSRQRLIRIIDDFVKEVEVKAATADGLSDVIALERLVLGSLFPRVFPSIIPRFAAAMGSLAILTNLASSIPDGQNIALTITRGLPHNVTTEMDLKLWQVAKVIQSDSESLKHFQSRNADALAGDYLCGKLPSPAQCAVCQFMKKYGMRGLYEIDYGRPRWREQPAPLMNTLKSYIDIDEEHAPDRIFAAGDVAAKEAVDQLGQKLGMSWFVSFLARRIRSLAGLRELPKFTIIRIMGYLRAKRLEEGAKLVKADIIDDARDLFFLHNDELESLANGKLGDCKEIVRERKATMEQESKRTKMPRVIASDGFAFYGGPASSSRVEEGANVLYGEPVSPGTYEGQIRIVHDPSKTKLSHGEVLCCHGTDPSWTPLFLSAGALVMEVGGLMTHGSVVAREYGIPAVVGLEKVTERLSTGQFVRVDGSSGVVKILVEDSQEEP